MIPRIICAACRIKLTNGDTVVIYAHRHSHVFGILQQLKVDYDKNSVEQGFISWDGDNEIFVSRKEAARIAFAAGQIPKPLVVLYSEDLY